jgi:hypothetical protein
VLAALNDPEAFESLTDDFIVAAGDEEANDDEDQGAPPAPPHINSFDRVARVVYHTFTTSGAGRRGKRRPSRKVHFDDEDDGEYGEEDYDQDEDDEDLDALLEGLKANPEGNKRRERNEHEQIFDARFERVRIPAVDTLLLVVWVICDTITRTRLCRLWPSSTTTRSASWSRRPKRSRE